MTTRTFFTLPVEPSLAQTVLTTLNGVQVSIDFDWNDRASYWTMTVTDLIADEIIASGVPLLIGADVIRPFTNRLGAIYVGADSTPQLIDAGFDDLGDRCEIVNAVDL